MISRWLTCFSLAILAAAGAEVSGRITLRDSREAAVRKNSDFSGVVISLDPSGPGAQFSATSRHATMVQRNKTFTPHVLPIQVGTIVDFPNYDPIFHNAFSSFSGQIFDVGLYRPGSSRAVRFARPGAVRVFCNIHPTMSAVILVLQSSYFVKTGADGSFVLDVPPGRYELRIFHERATDETLESLARSMQVAAGGLQVPEIIVSEAGFLPTAHMNKYGKLYTAEPDNQPVYPGSRK